MVVVDVASEAMMSSGEVHVEPSLMSQNTLGNSEPRPKISNAQWEGVRMANGGGRMEKRCEMAVVEPLWVVRAHGVSCACGHEVPMPSAHRVLLLGKNTPKSMAITKKSAKFVVGDGGEG